MAKNKQLILHVGFHKTASTTIQASCFVNNDLLESNGICYPIYRLGDRTFKSHGFHLVNMFMANKVNFVANIKTGIDPERDTPRFFSDIEQTLSKHDYVVLSNESLSGLNAEDLDKLKRYFMDKDFSIRVIAYIRSPLEHTISISQEKVKAGGIIELERRKTIDLAPKIQKFINVFGESVEFHAFRDTVRHPYGPVGYFLELIGVSKENLSQYKIDNKNESISNTSTRLISYINSRYPLIVDGKINSKRQNKDTWPLHDIAGGKFKLSTEEYELIRPFIDKDNQWLRENLGQHFCDRIDGVTFSGSDEKMGVTGLASATLPCSNLIRAQVIKFLQEGAHHNIEQESRLKEQNLLKLQKKSEFSIHHLIYEFYP